MVITPASLTANTETNVETPSDSAQSSLAIMQADIQEALQKRDAQSLSHVSSANTPIHTDKIEDTLSNTGALGDNKGLNAAATSRIIEMAWEDRTPFAAIEHNYGLDETGVIKLMRQELKPASFRLWRQRVTGRSTKHQAKRGFAVGRAYCKTQYKPR